MFALLKHFINNQMLPKHFGRAFSALRTPDTGQLRDGAPLSPGNAEPAKMQVSVQLCSIAPTLLVYGFTGPTWQVALADP